MKDSIMGPRGAVFTVLLHFLAALSILGSPGTMRGQAASGAHCFGPETNAAKIVLGKVRKAVSDPRASAIREAMGLVLMPADSAVLETHPGKCNLARLVIDRSRGEQPTQRRLVLVRIGARYWAEDPVLKGGEFTDVYLLDRELTRLIRRH